MKTLFAAWGAAKALRKWMRDIRRRGKNRLAPIQAKRDRLALERIVHAMALGHIKDLPWWMRGVCKWMRAMGLLKELGEYGKTVLKSSKLERGDPVLYSPSHPI